MKIYFDFKKELRRKRRMKELSEYRYCVLMIAIWILMFFSGIAIDIYSDLQRKEIDEMENSYAGTLEELENAHDFKSAYISEFKHMISKSNRKSEVLQEVFERSRDFARINRVSIEQDQIVISGMSADYLGVSELLESLNDDRGFDFRVRQISKKETENKGESYSFTVAWHIEY